MNVCRLDCILIKAKLFKHVEVEIVQLLISKAKRVFTEIITKRKSVERKLDVKRALDRCFHFFQLDIAKAFVTQRACRDGLALFQAATTNGVVDNVVNLILRVAHIGQRFGNNAVDNLEVATASKLFELYDRKVRLDTGCVAIHDQTDGACWRNNRGLCVAVTVGLTKLQRLVPCGYSCCYHGLIRAGGTIKRHRQNAKAAIAG